MDLIDFPGRSAEGDALLVRARQARAAFTARPRRVRVARATLSRRRLERADRDVVVLAAMMSVSLMLAWFLDNVL